MAMRTISFDATGAKVQEAEGEIELERAITSLAHGLASRASDLNVVYVHYVFNDGTSATHIAANTIEKCRQH